jgi:hypothetical protein
MILPGYKSGLLSRTRFGPLAIKISLNPTLKKKHRFRIMKNILLHHTICLRGKAVQTGAITKTDTRNAPQKRSQDRINHPVRTCCPDVDANGDVFTDDV